MLDQAQTAQVRLLKSGREVRAWVEGRRLGHVLAVGPLGTDEVDGAFCGHGRCLAFAGDDGAAEVDRDGEEGLLCGAY